jgi:tRNA(fMet)-specific endonuclease VapC
VIVVDTSVWIEFFRGKQPLADALAELLDRDQIALPVPVRIEILGGARKSEQSQLARVFTALPLLLPSENIWTRIEQWVVASSNRGQRFGVGDLLIAAIAAEQGHSVWSLDSDFARMAKLGFCSLYRP